MYDFRLRCFHGALERTRTSDARFRKPTLYPLSYKGASEEQQRRFYHDHVIVQAAFTPRTANLPNLRVGAICFLQFGEYLCFRDRDLAFVSPGSAPVPVVEWGRAGLWGAYVR